MTQAIVTRKMNEERPPIFSEDTNEINLERLELALKASNEDIWDWKIDHSDIFYSKRLRDLLIGEGNPIRNLLLPPYEHIYADDREIFAQAVSEALCDHGADSLAIDVRVQACSGNWHWLRIRGTVARDEQGKTRRIAGSIIDISRRKRAEEQLEEERFQLRQLMDHVPVQLYIKDLDSRFVLANKGQAEWMGVADSNALIGKHDKDFFGEEHWKSAETDEQRIIKTDTPVTGLLEMETWKGSGDDTWVLTSKFPWKDKAGNIKGTFGVSSDVTKLVLSEHAASDLAEQLREKNEIYEQEVKLAREIQQALAKGDVSDLLYGHYVTSYCSRYIPITTLAGDFFDVIQIDESRAGILICDVMGHGVRAALIVSMLRGLLEKQRSQAGEPDGFLKGLNEGLAAILGRAGTTMFATAFYGVIDLQRETFTYSCAGHPGPIVEGTSGVYQIATMRAEKGPGLGLVKRFAYPTTTIPLSEIRRILLFTDGILEAENQQGEPFFEKRLMDLISQNSHHSLDALLGFILSSVLSFSGAQHFDDDVCLLGIEIQKDPDRADSYISPAFL